MTETSPPDPAIELDTTGLRCPLPVIRLEAVLRHLAPGRSVRIIADDPIARVDIPHFCRAEGHAVTPVPMTDPDAALSCFLVTRVGGGGPIEHNIDTEMT